MDSAVKGIFKIQILKTIFESFIFNRKLIYLFYLVKTEIYKNRDTEKERQRDT